MKRDAEAGDSLAKETAPKTTATLPASGKPSPSPDSGACTVVATTIGKLRKVLPKTTIDAKLGDMAIETVDIAE